LVGIRDESRLLKVVRHHPGASADPNLGENEQRHDQQQSDVSRNVMEEARSRSLARARGHQHDDRER
jgi:hypothetical protein